MVVRSTVKSARLFQICTIRIIMTRLVFQICTATRKKITFDKIGTVAASYMQPVENMNIYFENSRPEAESRECWQQICTNI